jgi:hypothetical protein
MLNIEKQVELAVVCGRREVWEVEGVAGRQTQRQRQRASWVGWAREGRESDGGGQDGKREKGWVYEDGQKRTKQSGLPSGSVVTVVREKSGADSISHLRPIDVQLSLKSFQRRMSTYDMLPFDQSDRTYFLRCTYQKTGISPCLLRCNQ